MNNIIKKYNINFFFSKYLTDLENYKICVICDDSGSMCNPVKNLNETRWSQLQTCLKIIIDIASLNDENPIDIYYLNRPPIKNVLRSEDLNNYENFNDPPEGFTPLGETIQTVLKEKKSYEKNLLIIIFTDGQPNNMKLFMDELKNRDPIDKIFISFVACTDDKACVGYLNNLDKEIKNINVYDDYNTEKERFKLFFTFGDYITKILLGSVNKNIDKLFEDELFKNKKNKSFCIIS